MKSNKELLELLMFTVNEKFLEARSKMDTSVLARKHYYHGNMAAFSEVYTLLKNELEHESKIAD